MGIIFLLLLFTKHKLSYLSLITTNKVPIYITNIYSVPTMCQADILTFQERNKLWKVIGFAQRAQKLVDPHSKPSSSQSKATNTFWLFLFWHLKYFNLSAIFFFFLAFPTFKKILLERKDSPIILFFSSSIINNLSSLKQYLSLLLLMNVMKRPSQWCFLHFCWLLSRVGL